MTKKRTRSLEARRGYRAQATETTNLLQQRVDTRKKVASWVEKQEKRELELADMLKELRDLGDPLPDIVALTGMTKAKVLSLIDFASSSPDSDSPESPTPPNDNPVSPTNETETDFGAPSPVP